MLEEFQRQPSLGPAEGSLVHRGERDGPDMPRGAPRGGLYVLMSNHVKHCNNHCFAIGP